MSKLAFILCVIIYVAAEGGAIFEMTGDAPKIVFGELEQPICELKLDRANIRLESTCDIFSAENEVLKATVAALETNNTELKAEVAELKTEVAALETNSTELKAEVAELKTWKTTMEAQMEHVMKTIAVITPPPSLPPSLPLSVPPVSPAVFSKSSILCNGISYERTIRTVADDFTIVFDVRFNASTGQPSTNWHGGQGLIDSEVAGIYNDFGVSMSAGHILFGIGNPDTTIVSPDGYGNLQWHHVIATRTKASGLFQLFINDILVGSKVGSTRSLNSASYTDFCRFQTGMRYFTGELRNIFIFDVDIS